MTKKFNIFHFILSLKTWHMLKNIPLLTTISPCKPIKEGVLLENSKRLFFREREKL